MEKRVVTFTSTSYNIGIPNPPKQQRVLEKVQPFHLSSVRRLLLTIVHLQKGGVEKHLDLVIQSDLFGMVSSRDPFKGWKRDLQRSGMKFGHFLNHLGIRFSLLIESDWTRKDDMVFRKGLLHQQFQRTVNFQLVFDFMGKPFAASVQFQSSSILVDQSLRKVHKNLGMAPHWRLAMATRMTAYIICGGILGFPTNPTVKPTERPGFQGNSLPMIRLLLQ